jgi:hypothetical protein
VSSSLVGGELDLTAVWGFEVQGLADAVVGAVVTCPGRIEARLDAAELIEGDLEGNVRQTVPVAGHECHMSVAPTATSSVQA